MCARSCPTRAAASWARAAPRAPTARARPRSPPPAARCSRYVWLWVWACGSRVFGSCVRAASRLRGRDCRHQQPTAGLRRRLQPVAKGGLALPPGRAAHQVPSTAAHMHKCTLGAQVGIEQATGIVYNITGPEDMTLHEVGLSGVKAQMQPGVLAASSFTHTAAAHAASQAMQCPLTLNPPSPSLHGSQRRQSSSTFVRPFAASPPSNTNYTLQTRIATPPPKPGQRGGGHHLWPQSPPPSPLPPHTNSTR